jgi:hypothetical protein
MSGGRESPPDGASQRRAAKNISRWFSIHAIPQKPAVFRDGRKVRFSIHRLNFQHSGCGKTEKRGWDAAVHAAAPCHSGLIFMNRTAIPTDRGAAAVLFTHFKSWRLFYEKKSSDGGANDGGACD